MSAKLLINIKNLRSLHLWYFFLKELMPNSSRNVAFNRMGGSSIGNQETNAANDHNRHMRDRDATVDQDVFF